LIDDWMDGGIDGWMDELMATILRDIEYDIDTGPHTVYILLSSLAKEHLLEEKEKIEMKLSLLLEEKELVVKHLDDQDAKYRDVVDVENSLHQRAKIVKNTVNNLQLEIEKLRILLSSTDENHENDDECGRGDCV